jgi:hypothetical protein
MSASKPISAKKDFDRVPVDNIFDKYLAISKKLSDVSVAIGQVVEEILSLDREIRQCDPANKLMMSQKLRMKVLIGAIFPVRQHIDRLTTRMNACAAFREAVVTDASRADPAFE